MHPPRLVLVMPMVCLTICVGCESTRTVPVTPSPVGYSLAGTVYDAALRPLAEVRIETVEGSRVGVSAVSDGAGHYELAGTFTGAVVLRAEKPGYSPITVRHEPPASPSSRSIRDIHLTDSESGNLTGDWTVTLMANASCKEIPETVRTRSYTASIRSSARPHHFEIQLYGATLYKHWSNRISVSLSGTAGRFEIEAWDWGLGIAEDLGESRQLFIWGEGAGSATDSTIVAVLTGGFEYAEYAPPRAMVNCESFDLKGFRR